MVLGKYSVDLKNRLKFSSEDPDNLEKQHLVIRGHSDHRRRAGLPKQSRFTVGSETDPLVKISTSYWTLGDTWHEHHNDYCNPSFNQIVEGLLEEVMRQIELDMANMNQLLVSEAKANLKKTWEDLFSLADVEDRDEELTHD